MFVDHLLNTKKEFKNLKKQDTNYIYRNELDKACFQHDMDYGDFKDLARRTASDKVLRDKAFNIAKSPKYDSIKGSLLLWFINFVIKHLQAVVVICLQIKLKSTIS